MAYRCLISSFISGVYGSVPQSVLDEEEDLIRHAHSTASDLVWSCQLPLHNVV